MTENQGVCVLAIPLDAGDDPPVLVAGDMGAGPGPKVYARSLDEFVDAWAWDRACMERATVLQAQAAELDAATERYLRSTPSRSRRRPGPGRRVERCVSSPATD